jgi:hypothetical protein
MAAPSPLVHFVVREPDLTLLCSVKGARTGSVDRQAGEGTREDELTKILRILSGPDDGISGAGPCLEWIAS